MDTSHYISGSITDFADTCSPGFTTVVTGNDTTIFTGMSTRYSVGFVLKRNAESAVVVLFSYSNKEIYIICKNDKWDSSAIVIK